MSERDPYSFVAVNGRALILLAVAFPAGGLLLFGLAVPDSWAWGALLAWVLALADVAVSGHMLATAIRTHDLQRAFRQVGIGLAGRVVGVLLVVFALARIDAIDGRVFAVSFVVFHLVCIGGWAQALMADQARIMAAGAAQKGDEDPGGR
ncbi:MAG: hypothetical protein AB7K09_26165 [Planctomycetota bacterium]